MGVGEKSPNWTHHDFGRSFQPRGRILRKIKMAAVAAMGRGIKKKKKKEKRKTDLLYMGANGDRPRG